MSKIQHQVKLPLSVAFGVAVQGIQVRFGRSVVTIMGVMLGIAFLMAILTGQVIKSGVAEEQAVRQEARRMYNFLVADMGPPRERVVSLLQAGTLSPEELRLVRRIAEAGPAALRIHRVDGVPAVAALAPGVEAVSLEQLGENTNALIVIGDGSVSEETLRQALAGARYRLVAQARQSYRAPVIDGVSTVVLERELREEEIEQRALEAKQEQARNLWIIVISLLVTVIGISNSMLMSVTERFREIGTMKCLGALSAFIRRLFLIESSFIGMVGALLGALVGMAFSIVAYAVTYGIGLVFESLQFGRLGSYFVMAVILGVILSVLAAIYPASFASRMLPAHALRSNI